MSTHVSRRHFLKFTGAAAAVGALGAPAALAQTSTTPRPRRQLPRRFVIDAHHHFSPDVRYFDWLVPTYRKNNAMVCVNGWRREFAAITEGAKKFPDVVIPYGRINPDDPGAAAEVDFFAANGARGIKLHSPQIGRASCRERV